MRQDTMRKLNLQKITYFSTFKDAEEHTLSKRL